MYLIYKPSSGELSKISFKINPHQKQEPAGTVIFFITVEHKLHSKAIGLLYKKKIPYKLEEICSAKFKKPKTWRLLVPINLAREAITAMIDTSILKADPALEEMLKKVEAARFLQAVIAPTLSAQQTLQLQNNLFPHLQKIISFSTDTTLILALLKAGYQHYGLLTPPFDKIYLKMDLESIFKDFPDEEEKRAPLIEALLSFSKIYHGALTASLGNKEKSAPDLATQKKAINDYVRATLTNTVDFDLSDNNEQTSHSRLHVYKHPHRMTTKLDSIRYAYHPYSNTGLIELVFRTHAILIFASEERITEAAFLLSDSGIPCSVVPRVGTNELYNIALHPQHFRQAIECLHKNLILSANDRASILGTEGPMKTIENGLRLQGRLSHDLISSAQIDHFEFILGFYIDGILDIATSASCDRQTTLSIFTLASARCGIFPSAEIDLMKHLKRITTLSEENIKNVAELLIPLSKALYGELGLESTLEKTGSHLPNLALQRKVLTDFIDKKVAEKFANFNNNTPSDSEPPLVQPGLHGLFAVSGTPITPINNPIPRTNQASLHIDIKIQTMEYHR